MQRFTTDSVDGLVELYFICFVLIVLALNYFPMYFMYGDYFLLQLSKHVMLNVEVDVMCHVLLLLHLHCIFLFFPVHR